MVWRFLMRKRASKSRQRFTEPTMLSTGTVRRPKYRESVRPSFSLAVSNALACPRMKHSLRRWIYVQNVKAIAVDYCGVVHNINAVLLQSVVEMGVAVDEIAWFVLVNDVGEGEKTPVALVFGVMDAKGGCVGQHNVDLAPKAKAPGHAAPDGSHLPLGILDSGRVVVEHGSFKTDDG